MTMAVRQRRVARVLRPGAPKQVIEVAVEDIAELEPGQALVRVKAAAVNHSEGLALRGGAYAEGVAFPCPLGYEGAGTVVATGPEAGIEVGTPVCWAPVVGSCADYVTAPAAMLVPVPDGLGAENAARLPSAGVTAQLLTRVWPLHGKTAVVWGAAGPVGRMLVALLCEGGTEVIGVASGERVEVVGQLGAAHAIDRAGQDVVEAVHALTDGRGVTAVFDPVGAATYRANLAMLGRRGCLINYGELSGELPTVDLMELMEKGLFVTKFGGGGAYLDALSDLRGLVANALALALRRPQVISDVGGRFSLEQVADGYQAVQANPPGKILIVPDHDPGLSW
jgi:NADPH:quinone reductase